MFLSYASHLHRSHHRRDGSDDSTFIVKDNNDQGGCHVHRTDGCGDGIDRTGRGRNSVTSSSSPPPSTSNSQQPKPSSPPSPQPQQHQQRQQHAHQFLNYVVLNDSYHTRNKEITTPITTTTAATVMNATHVSIDKVPTDKEQNTDGHLLFEETSTDRKIHDSHKFQNKCDLHRFLEDDMMKNIIIAASSCTSADGIDASSTTTKLLLKSFRKSARQATTITNDETNNKINANDDDIAMESFYRSILFNIFASSSSSEEVEEFHGNEEVMKTTQTKEKLNHSKNNDFAKAVDNTIGNEEVDPFELLWNEDSKSIVFEDNPQQHSFKSSSFSEEEGDSLDLLLHKEKAERNELRFLRLVVKNLVETIILTSRTNDDTRHHQKQQQQQQQQPTSYELHLLGSLLPSLLQPQPPQPPLQPLTQCFSNMFSHGNNITDAQTLNLLLQAMAQPQQLASPPPAPPPPPQEQQAPANSFSSVHNPQGMMATESLPPSYAAGVQGGSSHCTTGGQSLDLTPRQTATQQQQPAMAQSLESLAASLLTHHAHGTLNAADAQLLGVVLEALQQQQQQPPQDK